MVMSGERIAFIGTGIMGGHMARRLAGAGFAVSAWNRSAAKAEALASSGVCRAATVREALAGAAVALVMLSTGDVVQEVLFGGSEPALSAMRPGSTLVVMSSIPVELSRDQAEAAARHGIDYVDAPVSGGEPGAQDGTLAILAGGDVSVIEALGPVFAPLGRATRIGPVGAGQATKLANQIIVGGTLTAIAEALTFAAKNGADPKCVRGALAGGFGDSKVLQVLGERMVERNFVPGSPAEYQLKDLRTAQSLAGRLGLKLTLLDTLAGMFADMVAHEGSSLDVSGILREVERRAGALAAA